MMKHKWMRPLKDSPTRKKAQQADVVRYMCLKEANWKNKKTEWVNLSKVWPGEWIKCCPTRKFPADLEDQNQINEASAIINYACHSLILGVADAIFDQRCATGFSFQASLGSSANTQVNTARFPTAQCRLGKYIYRDLFIMVGAESLLRAQSVLYIPYIASFLILYQRNFRLKI